MSASKSNIKSLAYQLKKRERTGTHPVLSLKTLVFTHIKGGFTGPQSHGYWKAEAV